MLTTDRLLPYRLTSTRRILIDILGQIFKSIERWSKVEAGYSGLTDMTEFPRPNLDNKQQSWFLAETLKYLYLLFSPEDVLPLDQWVFNTEAHPLQIFSET